MLALFAAARLTGIAPDGKIVRAKRRRERNSAESAMAALFYAPGAGDADSANTRSSILVGGVVIQRFASPPGPLESMFQNYPPGILGVLAIIATCISFAAIPWIIVITFRIFVKLRTGHSYVRRQIEEYRGYAVVASLLKIVMSDTATILVYASGYTIIIYLDSKHEYYNKLYILSFSLFMAMFSCVRKLRSHDDHVRLLFNDLRSVVFVGLTYLWIVLIFLRTMVGGPDSQVAFIATRWETGFVFVFPSLTGIIAAATIYKVVTIMGPRNAQDN